MARMRLEDVEGLRRSLASAPLSKETVRRVLDEQEALLHERAELKRLLVDLRPSWARLRDVLSELDRRLR
jgi:hypothetical protein